MEMEERIAPAHEVRGGRLAEYVATHFMRRQNYSINRLKPLLKWMRRIMLANFIADEYL